MRATAALAPRLALLGRWAHPPLALISRCTRRTWYFTLSVFPIPSENKWRGMVEMMALSVHTMLSRENQGPGAKLDVATDQSLEQLGDLWTWRRVHWLGARRPFPPAVRSTLVLTFKTLDMPTTVTMDGGLIKAVTTRCPFLEQSMTKERAERLCKAICSDEHSLFRGVAKGFPCHINYRAPAMMGHGDAACVKLFSVGQPLGLPALHQYPWGVDSSGRQRSWVQPRAASLPGRRRWRRGSRRVRAGARRSPGALSRK